MTVAPWFLWALIALDLALACWLIASHWRDFLPPPRPSAEDAARWLRTRHSDDDALAPSHPFNDPEPRP